MKHQGSCHCGAIRFAVEGTFDEVMECNCSHCSRKGYLLWMVPRVQLSVNAVPGKTATYLFNKHVIQHQFCVTCGCAPFGLGEHGGVAMAAINVRCLEDIDLSKIKRKFVDGRSF